MCIKKNKFFINLVFFYLAWYQRSYFNFMDKDIIFLILDDYKIIIKKIKKNNLYFVPILIIFIPIISLFILIYFFLVFIFFSYYFIMFIFNFIFSKFNFILKKKFRKIIVYNFPKNLDNSHNNFLLILLIFFDLSKKQGYMIFYFLIKKKHVNYKLIYFVILNFLLRFIFYCLIGFSVKIVKISSIFLDIFFKNFKKKGYLKYDFNLENTLIDFIFIYNDFYNNFVKKSKVIINEYGYINNPKSSIELLLDILKVKCNFTNKDLVEVINYVNILKENGDIRYNVLRSAVNNNDLIDVIIDDLGNFYIGEKIPHTSFILPVLKEESLLIRETKQTKVFFKIKNQLKINKSEYFFETYLPNTGSINLDLIARKTPPIIVNNKDIVQINNSKLLSNIRSGLVDKNAFVTQLVLNLHKPFYNFEKGSLYHDPKYWNLHSKIFDLSSKKENTNEILNSLSNLSRIYRDHFEKFMDIQSNEILLKLTEFIINETNYIIDDELLQMISEIN